MLLDRFKNGFIFLLSVLIAGLVCEGYLQIQCGSGSFCPSKFFDATNQSKGLYLKNTIYHLAPSKKVPINTHDYSVVYETNEIGLRDDSLVTLNRDEKIIALGDSQTFGEGVHLKDLFVQKIQHHIGKEIINMAVPGYGIGQIYYHYNSKIKHLTNVSGVILFALQTLYYRNQVDENNVKKIENFDFSVNDTNAPIMIDEPTLKSELYYLIKYVRLWIDQKDSLLAKAKDKAQNKQTPYQEKVSQLNRSIEKDERFIKYLKLIKNVNHRIPLCVVNISVFNLDFIEKIKNEINFEYIDLSEELVRFSGKQRLRFEYDRHYNAKTHDFIAKSLNEKILKCLKL